MSDIDDDFRAFREKYLGGEIRPISPWQQDIFDRVMSGTRIQLLSVRRGKREAARLITAFWESAGQKWDVVGPTPESERAVRREARELAARIAALSEEEGA